MLLAIDDDSEIEADDFLLEEKSTEYDDYVPSHDDTSEIEELDPELFKDPVKLVKWIEKHS